MGFMDRIFSKKVPKGEHEIRHQGVTPTEAPKVIVDAVLSIEEASETAMQRAQELQAKEMTMPSLEDAAEDEKGEVMRLDAESDAWSRIAGIFSRTSSETDGAARLARIRNELVVLRSTNLDKGPEAEIIKSQAIEQIEKMLVA